MTSTTSKMAEQIVKELEGLDYREIDKASRGQNHIIMEHPYAGRIIISRNLGDNSKMHKQLVSKARRQVSQSDTNAAAFMEWLRKKYMVEPDDSVVITSTMNAEVKEWNSLNKIGLTSIPGFSRGITTKGYVKMLKQGQGPNPSTIEIYGSDFAPPDAANGKVLDRVRVEPSPVSPAGTRATKSEPMCGEPHPEFPAVYCELPPNHDGEHQSSAVEQGWWTQPTAPEPEYVPIAPDADATKEAIIALARIHAPELFTPKYELERIKQSVENLRDYLNNVESTLDDIEQSLKL